MQSEHNIQILASKQRGSLLTAIVDLSHNLESRITGQSMINESYTIYLNHTKHWYKTLLIYIQVTLHNQPSNKALRINRFAACVFTLEFDPETVTHNKCSLLSEYHIDKYNAHILQTMHCIRGKKLSHRILVLCNSIMIQTYFFYQHSTLLSVAYISVFFPAKWHNN